MKVDFSADAPFSIKEDIDALSHAYSYITWKYGGYLLIAIIAFIALYAYHYTHPPKQDPALTEEIRLANEERMKRVRRMQVGDSLEDKVRRRKQEIAEKASN
ncbi:uncharacterized protein [Blastocystis hominis]|uniref:Uncharacterized protein n=1 Tax=Blastocystis hominis TaxID=12968 RepID=D8LYM9_BLAHO|nr:uncharacterized protein [Blastocystis hominis]CBK20684.2 unnamed protein product [Blastocystis hominis]|eukprot:XP_012894732.1 uncharacterized protein [Blastocystis hominis]